MDSMNAYKRLVIIPEMMHFLLLLPMARCLIAPPADDVSEDDRILLTSDSLPSIPLSNSEILSNLSNFFVGLTDSQK